MFSKDCDSEIKKVLNKNLIKNSLDQNQILSMTKTNSFTKFHTPELFKKPAIGKMLNIKIFYLVVSNILLSEILELQGVINKNKDEQSLNFFRQISILLSFILNIFSIIGLLIFFKSNLNNENHLKTKNI